MGEHYQASSRDPAIDAEFFGISTAMQPDYCSVSVHGELDLRTVGLLQDEFQRLGDVPIRLDLGGLDFMDSSGIELLVRTSRQTHGKLTVGQVSRPVDRLFRFCGLEHLYRPR